ncbi:MAG: thiol-disulfide oxidoreductase DCC family protein [Flavobacteriales bacterium]
MQEKKIIVFDGVCILCNRFVQFILKRDSAKQFYFSTAQSEFVQQQFQLRKLQTSPMDSIQYMKDGEILTESNAVLEILSDLGGLWKVFSVFKLIPSFFRNALYRFCARRRYKVFGMRETCMIPDPDWKARFIN